jgi:hypothetical protein
MMLSKGSRKSGANRRHRLDHRLLIGPSKAYQERRLAQPEQKLRYDTPMSRLIQARERERLAKNPPTTNPAPFTLEQMNRLSDLDKIQISHYQKNNPGMSRAQIAAHLDAVIRNGWLKQR